MGCVVGYMLTWTTYGTWLQGDSRGWVKDGKKLGVSEGLLRTNIESMGQKSVSLSKDQREVVRKAIVESAKGVGQELLAIAVRSSHVHVVVLNMERSVSKITQRYKRDATYSVRSTGLAGKVWTKGYNVQYCFDEAAMRGRVCYVQRHGDR